MKKYLLVILVLVMCMSLFSCGSGNDKTISKTKNDSGNDVEKSFFEKSEVGVKNDKNTNIENGQGMESPSTMFDFVDGKQGYIISGYHGNETTIRIPSVYNNKKVVDLENKVFSGNVRLEKITLSEHMTSIDLSDFYGCDNLTTIIYPGVMNSVSTVIGPSGLKKLGLPKTKRPSDVQLSAIIKSNSNLMTIDLSSAVFNVEDDYSYLDGKEIIISKDLEKQILDINVNTYLDLTNGTIIESEDKISLFADTNKEVFNKHGDYVELLEGREEPVENTTIFISYNNRCLINVLCNSFIDIIEDCLLRTDETLLDEVLERLYHGNEKWGINGEYTKILSTYSNHDADDNLKNTGKRYEYIVYYYNPEINCEIIAKFDCSPYTYEHKTETGQVIATSQQWSTSCTYFAGLKWHGVSKTENAIPMFFNCNSITVNNKVYEYKNQ